MLHKLSTFAGIQGPVVIIVMDGYGLPKSDVGSAIAAARKPTLDRLFASYPNIRLRAHGTAVGMPSDDDMGNSEVGHNAIGAGRVFSQGATLVANAIAAGAIWQGEAWQQIVAGAKAGARRDALHRPVLRRQRAQPHRPPEGDAARRPRPRASSACASTSCSTAATCRETSALDYVEPFEAFLAELSARRLRCPHRLRRRPHEHHHGPLRGRLGDGRARLEDPRARRRRSSSPARPRRSTACARRIPGIIDQDLPPFVIARDGKPVGTIEDGDAVVFFNFRGDRAIEITRAFEDDELRQVRPRARPDVIYAGMMQYDGDLQAARSASWSRRRPSTDTMGEYLAQGRHRPVRHLRDPEVRPRHLLLERQPQRQVRRASSRPTSRSRPTACPSSSGRG